MIGDLALLPRELALELVYEFEGKKALELRNKGVKALLMMARTGLSLDTTNLQYREKQGIDEIKQAILEAQDIMDSGVVEKPTDDEMIAIEAEVMKVINEEEKQIEQIR